MIQITKAVSALGMLGGAAWFYMRPSVDFPAVLLGILSLSIFMMTLLPVSTEQN
jgi:hypothetical protein